MTRRKDCHPRDGKNDEKTDVAASEDLVGTGSPRRKFEKGD